MSFAGSAGTIFAVATASMFEVANIQLIMSLERRADVIALEESSRGVQSGAVPNAATRSRASCGDEHVGIS